MKYRSLPGLTAYVLVLISTITSVTNDSFGQRPTAVNGILNARHWDFANDRLALSGNWIWYDNQLLDPTGVRGAAGVPVEFPKLWNTVRTGEENSLGIGFATYSLTTLVPENMQECALDIPQVYSSYKVWINGQLVAQNGTVGINPENSRPQWKPQVVSFRSKTDTVRIVMQIANFDHFKGGCKEPIYLGENTLMIKKDNLDTRSAWAEFFILLALALLFLYTFLHYGRKSASLFFALLCLTWSTRSVVSNRYVFISVFPDFDWSTLVRIEYGMLYLTMIWGILFLDRMFKDEVNLALKLILITINIAFVGTALVASPIVFTRWLPVYLSVCGAILLYGAFIVIRAWINERVGSAWVTVSIFWGIGIFAYDIFAYEGLFAYNTIIFSLGYVVVFSLMGMALLYHLGVFKSTLHPSRLTFDEMYKDSPKL